MRTPHAYFRQQGGRWQEVRGQPLAADQWYDLQATYDHGELCLYVNGQLQAVKHGLPMDDDYPLHGPYIGKSDHLGGIFFRGVLEEVSIRAGVPHEESQVRTSWTMTDRDPDSNSGIPFDGQADQIDIPIGGAR